MCTLLSFNIFLLTYDITKEKYIKPMYSLKNNFKAAIFVTIIQVKKEDITIIIDILLKLQQFIPQMNNSTGIITHKIIFVVIIFLISENNLTINEHVSKKYNLILSVFEYYKQNQPFTFFFLLYLLLGKLVKIVHIVACSYSLFIFIAIQY